MRTARKLSIPVALAAVAGLALTGCAGGSPEQSPTAAPPGSVDLRMTVWTADAGQLGLFDTIADAYKAEHPEIGTISFDSLPFADYETTLTTQIAGGNPPDLAWMGSISADLIAADALHPLTETFKNTEGWNYDDLSTSITSAYSRDGELYAYPFSNSPYALYINKGLLAESGVALDTSPVTWEEISKLGAQVNTATGKAGFVIRDFEYATWTQLATVWAGWGASAWSEDGTKCELDSPEMQKAFEFLHEAIYVDGSMPGPGVTADFFAGDAAFTVAQVSRASLLDGSFEYDVLPLPEGPIGEYSVMGQAGMGVLSSGAHIQEATDFLAYLTNPSNAELLAQYFPPPRTSLLTGEALAANNTKLDASQLQLVVVDQIPGATTLPNHSNPAEILQTGKAAFDAMWNKDADVSAVLGSVCTAIQPLLSR